MPELPDVTVYVEAIAERVVGQPLDALRLASPFVLRTFEPRPAELVGKVARTVERLGKRIVLGFDGDVFAVIHLMVAGRFRWLEPRAKIPGKLGLLALDFPTGTLVLTEAGTKKRASLHLVRGRDAVAAMHAGGLEVLGATTRDAFAAAIRRESHTLKRTLTDPRILSGIGNAYSDEILHRAKLSPVRLVGHLSDDEVTRLFTTTREVLDEWTARLRDDAGGGFPEKVTAFRDEMAVHGKYGKPCPACGSPVQRIAYADNETNYCATCQTGGKLLADRSLSRLLRGDWPKSLEELETKKELAKANAPVNANAPAKPSTPAVRGADAVKKRAPTPSRSKRSPRRAPST